MKIIYFILSLFGLPWLSEEKTIKSNFFLFSLTKVPLKYLSKFTFKPGEGEIHIKVKIFRIYLGPNNYEYEISNNPNSSHIINVNISAYTNQEYQNIMIKGAAEAENRLVLGDNIENTPSQGLNEITALAYHITCKVPFNGEWSEEQILKVPVNESDGIKLFYITAGSSQKDIDKNKTEFSKLVGKAAMGTIRLGYEIKIFNSDGSHFSYEDSDLIYLFLALLFFYGAYIVLNTKSIFNEYKLSDSFNYPLILVLIAVFLEFFYLLAEFIHLSIYSYNGIGSRSLTLLARISSIVSQYIFTVILVLIAWGWSIFYMNVENFTCFAPFLILLGFFELLIGILARIVNEEEFKFHEYDDFSAYFIIGLRLGLSFYFLYGVCENYRRSATSLKSFFFHFGLVGICYFVALPSLLVGSFWFSEYKRKKLITVGISTIQGLAMILLTKLFTLKRGVYYNSSYKNNLIIQEHPRQD